jgi:hypothetical protein
LGIPDGPSGAAGASGAAGTPGGPGTATNPNVCGAYSVPLSCLSLTSPIADLNALQFWSTGKHRLGTFAGGPVETSASAYDAIVFWGDGTNSRAGVRSANVWVVLDTAGNPEVFGQHTYATAGLYTATVVLWVPGQDAAEVAIPVSVAANVTDQVTTASITPTVNPATGLSTAAITFSNPTAAPGILGQFDVLLADLPSGVRLASATLTIGTATYTVPINRQNPRAPFLEIPTADLSDLTAGESITLNVTFRDPLGTPIMFAPGLFAAPVPAAG